MLCAGTWELGSLNDDGQCYSVSTYGSIRLDCDEDVTPTLTSLQYWKSETCSVVEGAWAYANTTGLVGDCQNFKNIVPVGSKLPLLSYRVLNCGFRPSSTGSDDHHSSTGPNGRGVNAAATVSASTGMMAAFVATIVAMLSL